MASAALERMQQGEITEHEVYSDLARRARGSNRAVLKRIANDELGHYGVLKRFTGKEFSPKPLKVFWYTGLARVAGLSFSLKMMENGEGNAQTSYARLSARHPALRRLLRDETRHEAALISMLKGSGLEYASSHVEGLILAVMELLGALAGLTLVLQDSRLIAASGLTVGMASILPTLTAAYVAADEEGVRRPLKPALHTGLTYAPTVVLLVAPYFFLADHFAAIAASVLVALGLISAYTFYVTTAKSQRFFPRFVKLAGISLGVAALGFALGHVFG